MTLGNHTKVAPIESLPSSTTATLVVPSVLTEAIPKQATTDGLPEPVKAAVQPADITEAELENEYMRRASAYVDALPDTKEGTPQLIKVVSNKMRVTYKPLTSMDVKEKDTIKARFAFAIANYLNKTLQKGPMECAASSIKQKLEDVDGDFLKLCAMLVEEKHMSLETLDDVTGLVKALLDILPKAELTTIPGMLGSKVVLEDPVDNMKTWPTAEKRSSCKSIAQYFTWPALTMNSCSCSYMYSQGCLRRHQYQSASGSSMGWKAGVHLYARAWILERSCQIPHS